MLKFYDAHGHLNCKPLDNEVEEIIKQMRLENIVQNCSGYDLRSSLKAISYAKQYPDRVFATIAVHPNDVHKFDLKIMDNEFRKMLNQNKGEIVAIGECGLDCFYSTEYFALQLEWLKMHARLAVDYKLPLIFHIREAHNKLIEFLKENPWIDVPMVIHCFSQDYEIFKKYENLNRKIYYSIPGIVTFKKAVELQNTVKAIPINKLLSETDCPWLAPVPYRGKTNYPQYIKYTLEAIAKLRNESLEQLCEAIYNNATQIFWTKSKG